MRHDHHGGGAIAIAVGGLGSPEGFLGDRLGGTRETQVVGEGRTNERGCEFPSFLGILPVVVDFLREPVGAKRVAYDEVQTILA